MPDAEKGPEKIEVKQLSGLLQIGKFHGAGDPAPRIVDQQVDLPFPAGDDLEGGAHAVGIAQIAVQVDAGLSGLPAGELVDFPARPHKALGGCPPDARGASGDDGDLRHRRPSTSFRMLRASSSTASVWAAVQLVRSRASPSGVAGGMAGLT